MATGLFTPARNVDDALGIELAGDITRLRARRVDLHDLGLLAPNAPLAQSGKRAL
jgi:hypothetical protein